MEDYSLGKKEAFEEFRRNHYANNTSYQNHKDQLTALIKDAKQETEVICHSNFNIAESSLYIISQATVRRKAVRYKAFDQK